MAKRPSERRRGPGDVKRTSKTKMEKLANLRQDRLKKGAPVKVVTRTYKSDLARQKKSKPTRTKRSG